MSIKSLIITKTYGISGSETEKAWKLENLVTEIRIKRRWMGLVAQGALKKVAGAPQKSKTNPIT
jgi:hypothetical protein